MVIIQKEGIHNEEKYFKPGEYTESQYFSLVAIKFNFSGYCQLNQIKFSEYNLN